MSAESENVKWTAHANDDADYDVQDPAIVSYKPTGTLKEDYLFYTEALKIVAHPSVVPKVYASSADDGGGDESDEGGPLEVGQYDMRPNNAVTIRNYQLDRATLDALTLAMPNCTSLVALHLYNAGVDFAGIRILKEALPKSTIETLHLDYNPLTAPEGKESEEDEDSSCEFASLIPAESPLRQVVFRGNQITDAGAIAMSSALIRNAGVAFLNLFDNRIGEAGGVAIAGSLKFNTSIHSVSLANNRIGNAAAIAFGEALTRYPVTDTMMAERNEASARIAAYNDNVAAQNKKSKKKGADALQPLADLSPVEEVDGQMIAHGNRSLNNLDLSSNEIGETGLETLASALSTYEEEVSSSLHVLALHRNAFTDDSGRAAVKTIGSKIAVRV